MPPYLITVSLTSNTCDDQRTLDLIPGKTYTIGRASKNKLDMQAEPGNALFDCAVVSREHAELRSSPWQPPGKQVTLTDKKSLHGTTVNGRRLMPNSPFALKTGDVIKFGEKVARGDEAHDGISVTFHQIQPDHHSSFREPVSTSNVRGFHVPDDSEQSDYQSEDESFVSNPYDRSSAKTTPEQAKMGSQKQPIDLEDVTASHRKIISLVDEEDELGWLDEPKVPSASHMAPRGTVPESIAGESLLIPETLATRKTPHSVEDFDINDSDFDDDDEEDSVVEHNTGLSQILSKEDVAAEAEEESDEEVALDEGNEYAGNDQDEDEDIYSLGGSPEPSDVSDQDVPANEVSPSITSLRQTSEELGEPSAPARKPVWLDEFLKQAAAAPKPRYDPVRSSQPPDELAANSSTAAQSPPSGYTYYTPYTYGLSSTNLATDLSGRTRWDLQPASASAQSTVDSSSTPLSPVYRRPGQASYESWQYDVPTQEENVDFFSRPQTFQAFVETSSATVATPSAADSSSKGKLSIPNLLQPRAAIPEQNSMGTLRTPTFTESLTQADFMGTLRTPTFTESLTQADLTQADFTPASPEVTAVARSTKRKASAIASDDNEDEAAEPAAKKVATVDAATGTRCAIAIPTRTRSENNSKHSLARRVAGAAVRYTASATLGAAATVAFLNSTYAEQLIQYLS